MRHYEFHEGTPGIQEDEITQLFVPGCGRSEDGLRISEGGEARIITAARFFKDHDLLERGGPVVCAGYKSPRDSKGAPWRDPNNPHAATYRGIPEAISSKAALQNLGIPGESIRAEPNSIDTPTNFSMGRRLLNPGKPVGIVSHADHLERILDKIAPRVLGEKQPYAGIAVPPNLGLMSQPNKLAADLHTRWVMRRITPEYGRPRRCSRKAFQTKLATHTCRRSHAQSYIRFAKTCQTNR